MRLSKKNTKILILSSLVGASIAGTETQAAVIKGGSDITLVNVHDKEASGVAMTYTTYGNNQVASGSGVFVAPNIMLTVAHNYLDKDKANGTSFVRGGNSATSYVVMNSDSAKRGNNTSSGYDDIISKGNIHYYNDKEFVTSYFGDLAAVVTEKPVEAMTNGEDHARDLGVAKQGDKITFMGYPNDFSSKRLSEESKAKLVNGKMYKVSGTLSNLDPSNGSGTYNTSALGGFSGGPIFNEKGELVGIHQHGTNTDFGDDSSQHGGGLFFTDKHRKWINTMIAEHGIKGWFVNGNDKYYYDDNHKALVNTERDINGAKYRFDSNGRATLISGKESGEVVLRATSPAGKLLFERVIGRGEVGTGFSYDFKKDKETENYFSKVPNAKIVSIDGEGINKKFSESWSKDYVSKIALGKTTINMVVDGSDLVVKSSKMVNDDAPISKPEDKIKTVPNGEKNLGASVSLTSSAGLGSGTLINDDTIVTVAHNFVHLNTKNNPITVDNNVNKSGDVHYATLPNGKRVSFSNDDIHFWNREGFINGFKNDLAVVKLRNKFNGETGAKLHENVANLKQGDTIHVFGYPKGKLNPILNGKVETVENYGANIMGVGYQGSAPGMSGGGMFNDKGELIGVHQNGVEGVRAGGIKFSKEQLDWIKSVVNGNEIKPVYLKDEVRNDDKKDDKKDERPPKPEDKIERRVLDPVYDYKPNDELEVGSRKVIHEAKPATLITQTTYVWDEKEGYYKPVVKWSHVPEGDSGLIEVGTKPKELVIEVIKAEVEYVKDDSRKKGEPNIDVSGHDGAKTRMMTYDVEPATGLLHAKLSPTSIKEPVKRVVKVGARDDVKFVDIEPTVERVMDNTRAIGDDLTIPGSKGTKKIVTEYSVDPKTGNISEKISESIIKEAGKTIIKVGTRDLAKEKLEKEKLERERLEKERLEKERAEKEQAEKEKLEKERLEKLAKEKADGKEQAREKLAREKEQAEKDKLEKERLEKERLEKLAVEKAENERLAREKLEKERLEKERLEKLAAEKAENERLTREKLEKERLEKERLEKLAKEKEESERQARENLEKERLEKERLEKLAREKQEAEKLAREKLEKERLEKESLEKLAAEKAESERLAKEKLEKERLEKERLEKLAREKEAAEKLAREKEEQAKREKEEAEKLAKLKAEAEKKAKDKEEAERLQRERLELEKFAREKAEKERLARENAEKLAREKEEARKLAREKVETERLTKEKLEKERLAKEQAEKLASEKADIERQAREKLEKERLEKERLEKLAKEKQEAEKIAREKLEKERFEKERLEKLAKEKQEAEIQARERLEKEQLAKQQAEKLAREKEQADKLAKQQAEKLAKDKLEKEHLERLAREKEELRKLKLEEKKLLKEKAELELANREQKEREEAERLKTEKLRLGKEKLRLEIEELNRLEKDRLEKERVRLEEEKRKLDNTVKHENGDALINEKSEYSGILSGNGLDGEGNIIDSLVHELPEYKLEDIPKTNEESKNGLNDKNPEIKDTNVKDEAEKSTNESNRGTVKNSTEVKKELENLNLNNDKSVDKKVAFNNSKNTGKFIYKPSGKKLPETGSESYAALATFVIGVGSILGLRRRKKDKE